MSTIAAGNTLTTGFVSTSDTTGNLVFQTNGTTTALTLTTGQNATLANNVSVVGSVTSVNTFGFKNRIINGGMTIDQRNAGASITPTNQAYNLDRWYAGLTQSSKFTVQQNAAAITPPTGFNNYLGVTSSSAYSVLTGDTFYVGQKIEGYNIADLGWGTANAKTVTLSFWVRSSLTGTFGGSLYNNANRSYPFSYSISSANTWTQISVTVVGDTSGTWASTSATGIVVWFGLGSGSTYTATAGAWAAGTYVQPTGSVSVVGTNAATWYVTGVQLEVGSQATSFDFRDYGRELILCQRYYNNYGFSGNQWYVSATVSYVGITFPPMRIAPVVASTGGSAQYGPGGQLSVSVASYASTGTNYTGLSLTQSGGGTTNSPGFCWGSVQLNSEL